MRYCKYVRCMFDNAKDKEARAGDIQCCQALREGCLRSAFLALFISCSLASDGFPTGACSVQDQACEIHEYNLVASLPGVASVEECRQLCSDDQHCSHFSHFGPASFPIADVCFLSDPGKPGVRSLGPDVTNKQTDVCKT